ncbi:LysR family transcriptional regulator [Marmoricola endophyticus]|uniref:LysR family transcriptional regulator n=1 Tax=Marmoricola endophyticus TaxID=2040280 RepID=A0A917BFZ0_9ACTN|nr:LysR family transcriptional regulator [Marmoricola endophyticus]GGF37275.1 LysR family transcriptional regulator [Marmoricola endophyticus]
MSLHPGRLTTLLAVHRYGGVLAAADESGVTASAISQQMSKLEAEVGTPVLDRQPGGAVLTPAGRILADAAERIEAELIDAERALAVLHGELSGVVSIGAFQSFHQAVLVPLVEQLSTTMPGIELVLRDVAAEQGMRELRAGSLDLLMLEADSPAGLTAPRGTHDVAVLDERWLVALPVAAPTPTKVDDLAGQTWLGADREAAAWAATERVLSAFDRRPRVKHLYNNSDVAISMVEGGLGVALLPSLVLAGGLQVDGVRIASLTGLGSRRVVARHRSTRAEPRREVVAVLDEVVAAAQALDLGVDG